MGWIWCGRKGFTAGNAVIMGVIRRSYAGGIQAQVWLGHRFTSADPCHFDHPQRYPRIFQTSMNNRNAQQTVLFTQPIDFKRTNPSTKRYRDPAKIVIR
jgi:hypothetical protein